MSTEKLTPTQRFSIVNNFLGYGNSEGSLLFISGYEEAGDWSMEGILDDSLFEKYRWPFLASTEKDDSKRTPVYEIISKIITLYEGGNLNRYYDYYRNRLFFPEEIAMEINLFPLGRKKHNSWPTHYNDPLNFGFSSEAEYLKAVENHRFPLIKKFWEENKERLVTICFAGIPNQESGWDNFKKLFNLEKEENVIIPKHNIVYYPNLRIILTKFFDYRFLGGDATIEYIVKIIKDIKS